MPIGLCKGDFTPLAIGIRKLLYCTFEPHGPCVKSDFLNFLEGYDVLIHVRDVSYYENE
jgi:hypothetical protein